MATLRPPDHLGGPVRHRRGAELLTHCLHPAGQWELWPPADLTGAHGQRHLQVHGHLYHGVCGLHDRHVQPVLILPGSQVQSCLHHVSSSCCQSDLVNVCDRMIRWWLCALWKEVDHNVAAWRLYSGRFIQELTAKKEKNSCQKYRIWLAYCYNCQTKPWNKEIPGQY